MHEMALSESVLQILEHSARVQGFRRVRTVWLEVGDLAGVDREAMKFSFDVVVRGSVADDAKLEFVASPGKAWCMACADNVEISTRGDACPVCGSYQLQVVGGDELRVKELEVE